MRLGTYIPPHVDPDECRARGGVPILVRAAQPASYNPFSLDSRTTFVASQPAQYACQLPDAPAPAPSTQPVNVSVPTTVTTQVSPQVSPIFTQQDEPRNSPVDANAVNDSAALEKMLNDLLAAEVSPPPSAPSYYEPAAPAPETPKAFPMVPVALGAAALLLLAFTGKG